MIGEVSVALAVQMALDLTGRRTLHSTIPQPLQDRMDIIQLPGYSIDEKCIIAERHLVPRQLKEHGLVPISVEIANVQNTPEDDEGCVLRAYCTCLHSSN